MTPPRFHPTAMFLTTTEGSSKLPLPATTTASTPSSSYSTSGLASRFDGASASVTLRRRWTLLIFALLFVLGCHQLVVPASSSHQFDPERIRFVSHDDVEANPAGSSSLWSLYGRPNRSPSPSSSSSSAAAIAASSVPPKRIAPQAPFVRAYPGPRSLTEYLEAHFPLSSTSEPQPHLWLTLADSYWSTTGAAALNEFVDRLNQERWVEEVRTRGGVKEAGRSFRDTVVLTLCLDEKCMEEMGEMDRYAFGGYMHNRPEKVRLRGSFVRESRESD